MEKALEVVQDAGFGYVEVGLAHYLPHEATEDETREFAKALSERGVGLAALCGTYPISYPDEEVRSVGVQQFEMTIKRSNRLGCNLVVSELMGDAERHSDCAKAFRKSISELVPTLEEEGTSLCFEAHPGDFTDRNKIAVDLIRDLNTDRVGYLFCAPHSFILGEDVAQMVEYARDVLGYVHLADTLRPEKTFFSGRYFPQVPPHQHLTPGIGDVDLKALFLALGRVGYDGYITANPFSMYDDPLEAARKSRAFAESMIRLER